MQDLKQKLFSFGIYGTKISELTQEEIILLLEKTWVEIVSHNEIKNLQASFTLVSLPNERLTAYNHYTKNGFDLFLLNFLKNKYIRMETVAWKDYLTNGAFNFVSKEYYLFINLLLSKNEFVHSSELKSALNLQPKKLFYLVKKLASLGLLEKKSYNNGYLVKLIRDENGCILTLKNNQPNINIQPSVRNQLNTDLNTHDLSKNELRFDIPLYEQIRRLVFQSAHGISSHDIFQKFGIKIKVGLKLLTKLSKINEGKIISRDEFDGKIKRTKFYFIEQLEKCKNKSEIFTSQEEPYSGNKMITVEDRIHAIECLIDQKGSFLLDRDNVDELKRILGVKYDLDRRTIINSAIKGGFNVCKSIIKDNNIRYVISDKNAKEDEQIFNKISQKESFEIKKLSKFQQNIYRYFVIYFKFLEKDNGFISDKNIRNKNFYLFLRNISTQKQQERFVFDHLIINEMPLYLILGLLSFKKPNFKNFIIEEIRKSLFNGNLSVKKLKTEIFERKIFENEIEKENILFSNIEMEYKNSNNLKDLEKENILFSNIEMEYNNSENMKDEKEMGILYGKVRNFLMESSYGTYVNQKVEIKAFDGYFMDLEKMGFLQVFRSNGCVEIKLLRKEFKEENTIFTFLKNEPYISLKKRENFFYSVKDFPEDDFYDKCHTFIKENYVDEDQLALEGRLMAFKSYFPSISQSTKPTDNIFGKRLENLYIKIKEMIIFHNKLIDLNFKGFSILDLKKVLSLLTSQKIIRNYSSFKNLHLIEGTDFFKKKISFKLENHSFFENSNFLEMILCTVEHPNEYYKCFFSLIYHILMINGSMEWNILLKNIGIMMDFELSNFFEIYKSVFEINTCETVRFVSIRIKDSIF
ncbi:HTH domain-containing protein [Hamiltosporidium magnivora]|uniref:HTH domain-containing protein n=1 Tax=Hamiltosporidium magnivora TaxID=148818 RepID=A0A4Q9LJ31_9MICR|nr:HTH domain-containing protein [Hamiltosporidium magnivora]